MAAVDVLAAALAEAIGAREVSFLIADFSGRALIRLGHSGGEGALRLQGSETAERVPLVGTPHGRALQPAPPAQPWPCATRWLSLGRMCASADARRSRASPSSTSSKGSQVLHRNAIELHPILGFHCLTG